MKRLLILIVLVLLPGAATPVFAVDNVADSAASLTIHLASVDTRVAHLRSYLLSHDSPLASEAARFVAEADRTNLDWRLLTAISGVESTFGKQIPSGSYNAWGWGIPTGAQWGVAFTSWNDAITTISHGLKENYVDKGAVTIDQIGRIYAASPAWSWKVRYFIDQITDFRPSSPDLLAVTI